MTPESRCSCWMLWSILFRSWSHSSPTSIKKTNRVKASGFRFSLSRLLVRCILIVGTFTWTGGFWELVLPVSAFFVNDCSIQLGHTTWPQLWTFSYDLRGFCLCSRWDCSISFGECIFRFSWLNSWSGWEGRYGLLSESKIKILTTSKNIAQYQRYRNSS